MRSSILALCGCLLFVSSALRGQVAWNFTDGTSAASTSPSGVTASALTATNAGTLGFNNTSASAGYTGASGGNNASVTAPSGAFAAGTSSFLQFTLTPTGAFAPTVASISLGSRSTSTGPTTLALYSSINGFASAHATTAVSASGSWALVTFNNLNLSASAGSSITFRIYGYDGSGTGAGNWRIDDLAVTLTGPTITAQPNSTTVVSGQQASFGVTATGAGTLTYQWRKAGVAITGNPTATTDTLVLPSATSTTAGAYDVVVSDSLGSTVSSSVTLTVTKAPATVVVGTQTATYNGASQSATATTTPAGLTTTLSYTATSGTVYGPSATPPINAGTYTVTATINEPEYQGSATGAFTIEKAAASVTLGSLSATYNGSAHAASATTTPSGLPVAFTYNGSSTAPTNAGSYTVAATVNHQNYSGAATGTLVIAPRTASISLGALTTTYNGAPRVPTATVEPAGQTVTFTYTGIDGTFYGPSTTAPTSAGSYSVTAGLASANYSGFATGTLVIARASQTISFPPPPDRLTSNAPFALAATSSSELPVTFTLTSGSPGIATLAGDTVTLAGNPGAVTVVASQSGDANFLPASTVERTFQVVGSATAPAFILQPIDTTGFVGQSVTLTSSASGAPAPTYRWTKYGVDIAGATSPTLTLTSPTADDTGLYQAIATNIAGTASSTRVSLAITKRPQTITFAPPTTAYPPGTTIPLTVTASSGLPVSLTLISGAASLTNNSIIGQGGSVVVRASQPGNAQFDAAEPVDQTFTFVAGALAPFFSASPANLTVIAGAPATFRAAALGTPAPTYQWQKDGVDLPGATSATLSFATTAVADAGRYTVVATNSLGSARASADLVVRIAPEITAQPADQTLFAGETATLTVVATAIPAATYQWRRNGTAINGATAATLTLTNATVAQAGRYDVVVTNAVGSVTSAAATLTVTARNFGGAYFGQFSGANGPVGELAAFVRPDGTALFLAHLTGLQTGIATTNVRIGANGTFSLNLSTLAGAPEADTNPRSDRDPGTAAAPQPVTLRGTIDSETGELSGTVPELGASFAGKRVATSGPTAALSGAYTAAVVGSANGRSLAVVGSDGQAFVLTTDGTVVDSVRGTLDATGKLEAVSPGRANVSLTFTGRALAGSARLANGTTLTLAGANEAVAGTEHLANLSVRATANNATPLITGFVITGTASKQVLIRAAGPALAGAPFNVTGALNDPTIQVFRGNTAIAQNDDWGTPAANVAALTAATTRAGAFPFRAGSGDAALVTTLTPGAYTVMVGGGNGTALAEIYEVLQNNETAGARRLVNLSARGLVSPATPFIAGLVISGVAPQRVLIRGVGPTLGAAPFNVTGALPNPQLTLFRGSTAIASNDDWFRDATAAAALRTAAANAGAFALGAQSLDAALLLYLEPGAYTVQVSGSANAGTGIALVEVYEAGL